MNSLDQEGCTLPRALINKAVLLAGELSWFSEDALQAIQWLSAHGCAILGVEIWEEREGSPKWIASSDYNYELYDDWIDYCQRCADAASQFVKGVKYKHTSLFNLNYTSRKEFPG